MVADMASIHGTDTCQVPPGFGRGGNAGGPRHRASLRATSMRPRLPVRSTALDPYRRHTDPTHLSDGL